MMLLDNHISGYVATRVTCNQRSGVGFQRIDKKYTHRLPNLQHAACRTLRQIDPSTSWVKSKRQVGRREGQIRTRLSRSTSTEHCEPCQIKCCFLRMKGGRTRQQST